MYLRYNPGTPMHLPLLDNSFILLPIKVTQSLIEDLEQLQKDFFYKGQWVQEKCTCVNIENGNQDISGLYQKYYKDIQSQIHTTTICQCVFFNANNK